MKELLIDKNLSQVVIDSYIGICNREDSLNLNLLNIDDIENFEAYVYNNLKNLIKFRFINSAFIREIKNIYNVDTKNSIIYLGFLRSKDV